MSFLTRLFLGLVVTTLSVCASGGETPPAAADAALYFAPADFRSPSISPDGANVAFIAHQGGHDRLYRMELATGKLSGVFL